MLIHSFFELAAYVLGYRYYKYLQKREQDPIGKKNRNYILIAGAVGAILFSKFISIMENYHLVNESTPFYFYLSQKTIVGGLLGGLIGVEIVKKFLHISKSSGDLMTYPLILGIGVGRVGCFFAGLEDGTFGIETALPWGFDFGDGIKRHPTQIYEILFLSFLFLYIRILEKTNLISFIKKDAKLLDGLKFKIFLSHYLCFRLGIEYLKPIHDFYLGFSFIQLSCILGLVYYLFTIPKVWQLSKQV